MRSSHLAGTFSGRRATLSGRCQQFDTTTRITIGSGAGRREREATATHARPRRSASACVRMLRQIGVFHMTNWKARFRRRLGLSYVLLMAVISGVWIMHAQQEQNPNFTGKITRIEDAAKPGIAHIHFEA